MRCVPSGRVVALEPELLKALKPGSSGLAVSQSSLYWDCSLDDGVAVLLQILLPLRLDGRHVGRKGTYRSRPHVLEVGSPVHRPRFERKRSQISLFTRGSRGESTYTSTRDKPCTTSDPYPPPPLPYPITMAPSVAVRPAQDETLKPANNTHPSWWRDAGMRKLNLHLLILLLGSYTW